MSLTDKHIALLGIAAGRDDACLVPPERLLGAARHRMAARLIELGVAEPVPVAAGTLQWCRTEPEGGTGLRLTEAGRDAALEACTSDEGGAKPDEVALAPMPVRVPRPGSKEALLINLLSRESGASTTDISRVLGWQAHTVRAALTRLRQGGLQVERIANEAGRSVYRLAAVAEEQATGANESVCA